MSPSRRVARLTGILFIITFITSIPALLLYDPVLNHPNYILGAGADTRIFLGALLELLLIIANIGTAVALFPILKRQNESARARLCHGPRHGMRLHRRRHPQPSSRS